MHSFLKLQSKKKTTLQKLTLCNQDSCVLICFYQDIDKNSRLKNAFGLIVLNTASFKLFDFEEKKLLVSHTIAHVLDIVILISLILAGMSHPTQVSLTNGKSGEIHTSVAAEETVDNTQTHHIMIIHEDPLDGTSNTYTTQVISSEVSHRSGWS